MACRIVPKKSRDDVYRYLFTEGVLCAKKERLGRWEGELGGKKFGLLSHHLWYVMRSLNSKGLINEQFAWRHFYWTLNDKGIDYLRKYLHLAPTVIPNTLKKSAKSEGEREHERPARGERPEGGFRGRGGDRGRGGERGRGRGRGRGFGGDREAYQRSSEGVATEGGDARGRGRGFSRGYGRARGAAPAPSA